MEREQADGLREELEGPDQSGATTNTTGAGGESTRNDAPDRGGSGAGAADPANSDEAVIGVPSGGGSPPAFVAPPPDTVLPDPMGSDDEERELERRTR